MTKELLDEIKMERISGGSAAPKMWVAAGNCLNTTCGYAGNFETDEKLNPGDYVMCSNCTHYSFKISSCLHNVKYYN